jgi:cytochrome P450
VRAEHDAVLGEDAKFVTSILRKSPHKLNELRYTLAVFRECLRFYNLGASFRQAGPDFAWTLNGIHYPSKGFMIQTGQDIMNYLPHIWSRPDEFIPERYLVSEGDPLYPVKHAWRGFEIGSMSCIGQELAMMEFKVALALTVREFDFDFPWKEWDTMRFVFAFYPIADVQLTVVIRGVDESHETINGDRGYQTAGHPVGMKDQLPTRVRLRS